MHHPLAALAAVVLLSSCPDAFAVGVQRTFVSTSGNDANAAVNCSLSSPCRSFGGALNVTASSGEIIVLGSGGYGRVTIDRSVSIIAAPGVYAGISVFAGTNGIDINTPGVNVVLRGLTINGQGGDNGIDFVQGAELTVENCVFENSGGGAGSAILAHAPGGKISIIDSLVRDTPYIAIWIRQEAAGQMTSATITNTVILNTAGWSLYVGGSLHAGTAVVYASRLTVTGAGSTAVVSDVPLAGATTLVSLADSTISGNGWGLVTTGAGAKFVASDNRIVRNLHEGVINSGGVFLSRGDNIVHDNNGGGAQTTGAIGSLTPL